MHATLICCINGPCLSSWLATAYRLGPSSPLLHPDRGGRRPCRYWSPGHVQPRWRLRSWLGPRQRGPPAISRLQALCPLPFTRGPLPKPSRLIRGALSSISRTSTHSVVFFPEKLPAVISDICSSVVLGADSPCHPTPPPTGTPVSSAHGCRYPFLAFF